MRVTKERAAGALLLVAIAASSFLLVFTSSLLKSPAPQSNSQTGGGPPDDNATGSLRLAINVVGAAPQSPVPGLTGFPGVLGTPPGVISTSAPVLSNGPALPSVNFTIVGVGLAQPPIRLVMQQPGEAEVSARVGFYTISTRNEYYNLSASALVTANSVTEVDVNVTESVLPALFSVVPNPDGSTVVDSWQPLTVEVATPTHVPVRGSTVFLEYGGSSTLCSPKCPEADSGRVVSKVLQSDPRESGLWLVISPAQPVQLASLGNLALLSFEASYREGFLGS